MKVRTGVYIPYLQSLFLSPVEKQVHFALGGSSMGLLARVPTEPPAVFSEGFYKACIAAFETRHRNFWQAEQPAGLQE